MEIAGKSAIVTGAASGIGRELALILAERKARSVYLFDIDVSGLDRTAERVAELGTIPVVRCINLANTEELALAFEEAASEGYELCFNNAGIVAGPPYFPSASAAQIDQLIRVNLTAALLGTQFAVRHMGERGGGVVINTGSTAATRPGLHDAPYRVSKAAIFFLTECCAPLAESAGVRVNAVHPGATETPILRKLQGGAEPPDWMAGILERIELLSARQVAAAAVDLAQDDGRHGENLILTNPATTHTGEKYEHCRA